MKAIALQVGVTVFSGLVVWFIIREVNEKNMRYKRGSF